MNTTWRIDPRKAYAGRGAIETTIILNLIGPLMPDPPDSTRILWEPDFQRAYRKALVEDAVFVDAYAEFQTNEQRVAGLQTELQAAEQQSRQLRSEIDALLVRGGTMADIDALNAKRAEKATIDVRVAAASGPLAEWRKALTATTVAVQQRAMAIYSDCLKVLRKTTVQARDAVLERIVQALAPLLDELAIADARAQATAQVPNDYARKEYVEFLLDHFEQNSAFGTRGEAAQGFEPTSGPADRGCVYEDAAGCGPNLGFLVM